MRICLHLPLCTVNAISALYSEGGGTPPSTYSTLPVCKRDKCGPLSKTHSSRPCLQNTEEGDSSVNNRTANLDVEGRNPNNPSQPRRTRYLEHARFETSLSEENTPEEKLVLSSNCLGAWFCQAPRSPSDLQQCSVTQKEGITLGRRRGRGWILELTL